MRRAVILDTQDTLPNGLILPAGTILRQARDVHGTAVVHFTLPDGYVLVSVDVRGRAESFSDGTLTCKCTEGSGGCSPFVATGGGRKIKGCVMSEACTKCEGKVNATRAVGASLHPVASAKLDLLHLASGVSHITGPEGLDSATCLRSSAAIEWEPFRRGVAQYLDWIQTSDSATRAMLRDVRDGDDLPAGFTMTYINAYGKLLRVPMQESATLTQTITEAVFAYHGTPLERTGNVTDSGAVGATAAASAKPTCTCIAGQGGCVYKSQGIPGIGRAEWCEANGCRECRMDGLDKT
jgi:hypothetical protein